MKLERDRLNYEKEEDKRTELEEQWELEEEEENRQICEYQQATTVGESGNTESNDFEVLQVEEVKTGAPSKVPGLNLTIVTDRDDPDEEEMEMLWQKGE